MSARTIVASPGEQISHFAAQLSNAATEGVRTEGEFNSTLAYAEPGDDPATVEARWLADFNAECARYRQSPEGQANAARHAEEVRANRAKAEKLVEDAPFVDWADLDATLAYLRECVEPLGWTYTTDLCPPIAKELRHYGYEPNVNCGERFNGDDRENFARYLIGQALDGLESGLGIHGIFGKMHDQWKAKFAQ